MIAMMEKLRTANNTEVEHLDDFGAMDVAVRGLKKVLERGAKGDAKLESEANEDWEDEDEDEDEDENYEDEYDYDEGEERQEILERENQFEVLTIPEEILEEYNLPQDLPSGVAIMGGTARSLARRLVTGDKEPVRDLDLVYVPEFEDEAHPVADEELDKIAERYMPDDFAYGHGINRENLKDYFGSRDFTINQCLVVNNKLMMTRAAYDDFQENIIRTSYYEQPRDGSYVKDRIFMKALLLQAALREYTSSYPLIEDVIKGRYDVNGEMRQVNDFDAALVLNKAMSRGVRTAMYLTEVMADFDIINERYIDQPLLLAKDIIRNGQLQFEFRPVDGSIDETNDELGDEPSVASPMTQEVRRSLREYYQEPSRYWVEPLSGKYTNADYAKVNTGRF